MPTFGGFFNGRCRQIYRTWILWDRDDVQYLTWIPTFETKSFSSKSVWLIVDWTVTTSSQNVGCMENPQTMGCTAELTCRLEGKLKRHLEFLINFYISL